MVSISSLISVVCQFVFNLFSVQNVPFDKWSILDLFNSVVNVSVLQIFNLLKPKDFIAAEYRTMIITMNLAMVIVSWTRFISFFLVISSMSRLLMTLSKMVTAAVTFLFITFCYLIMMVPVFGTLFQEQTINYVDPIQTMLTMWDVMITGGGIYFSDDNPYKTENDIWMLFHVLLSNVFLLNYLVAILATVYEDMLEKGDFAYKSNKYMYIERFYIPMMDQWGYTELVVHPPPMNYISALLLFTVFKNGMMLRSSEVISRSIFWLENIYYIFVMFA